MQLLQFQSKKLEQLILKRDQAVQLHYKERFRLIIKIKYKIWMPQIAILTMDLHNQIRTTSGRLKQKNNNLVFIIIEDLVLPVQPFNLMQLNLCQILKNSLMEWNNRLDKIIIILNFNFRKCQWLKLLNQVSSKQFLTLKVKFKLLLKHLHRNKKIYSLHKKHILKTGTRPKANLHSIRISILSVDRVWQTLHKIRIFLATIFSLKKYHNKV